MIDLEDLRCFLEAAKGQSFRAAARRVALSPAAFGQRIRRLEDELGQTLFQRTTRRVTLTEEGLALLPCAQHAMEAAAECIQVGRGKGRIPEVELVLGTRHELGMSWILPMVPRLEREHAGLTIHLYVGSGVDLVDSVRNHSIDCAVSSTRLTDPKIASSALHEERYVFVGQPALLKERPFTKPEHAKRHTLVDTQADLPLFRYWRDAPGGVDSMGFERMLRMGTIAAIRAVVLRGGGVAVLPEYYVAAALRGRKLKRIMPKVAPLADRFRLVYRADDPRRSLFAALAESMRCSPLR